MSHRIGYLVLVLVPLCGSALVSCGKDEVERFEYPRSELSTETVEFGSVTQGASSSRVVWLSNQGDLPMGVTSISLGTIDHSSNFAVDWNEAEIECPEAADTGAAKGFTADSGGGPDDTGGGTDDTGGGDTPTEIAALLDAGCRIPIHVAFEPEALGEQWGSLIIETGNEERAADAAGDPAYYSDPSHTKRIVYLVGEGERGVPNILVSPRRHDFGATWTGTSSVAFVSIRNAGDGDLVVQEPFLDGCSEAFAISAMGAEGTHTVLGPGVSTYVEVTYTAQDTNPASCTMRIPSDDPDSPEIDVDFEANTGTDPDNRPPTVVIRSPGNGYHFSGGDADSLRMELNVFDVNQPASSLICRVKSMVQSEGASVAHCDPPDDSGHVFVDVPFENVDEGVDTLRVQVTDAAAIISSASISVLWNVGYPATDDDGDGWGDLSDADEDGNYDCDDLDVNTYPFAAELPDGRDNDCDGVTDEGTTAYDDDGDSFAESEGDCNDYDAEIYPGAWELADYKDNDCDGEIDETTSLYDDDGDGYTEMDLDCNDDDAEVHPGATEYCDGVDNDCNGLRDYSDGCVELNSEPYIVGGIRMQQTACEPGDTLAFSVMAFDADGQALDYAWSADEGLTVEPLTGSPSVTVTCPEVSDGKIYKIHVMVADEDGNAVWDFDDVGVYPTNKLYVQLTRIVRAQGGCSSGGALAPVLSLAWLALAGAGLRRRQS